MNFYVKMNYWLLHVQRFFKKAWSYAAEVIDSKEPSVQLTITGSGVKELLKRFIGWNKRFKIPENVGYNF